MPTRTTTNETPDHLATSEILFDRILIATDFSKPAHQALKAAMALCQMFGAKLILFHVSTLAVVDVESGPLLEDMIQASLESDTSEMNDLVSSEDGLKELKPRVLAAFGEAVDLINTTCKKEKADLIVVGSHGASGLERLALGSVAESVLYRAACPVMIVGPNCSMIEHPFRSIVLATDLISTGLRAAQYATGLAERFHGKLTLLHVLNEDGLTPKALLEERAHHKLERLLPNDIQQYCKTEIRIVEGKPAKEIVETVNSSAASLLVVGLRDHPFGDHATWSTLSYVIREAKCPVLGVRSRLI